MLNKNLLEFSITTFIISLFILIMFFAISGPARGAEAKIEMTYIYSSNCHWCDRFKEEVLDNPEVKEAMKDIKIIKLDMYDPSIKEIVRAVPYIIFTKNGVTVKKFVGYVYKDQFLKIIEEVKNA